MNNTVLIIILLIVFLMKSKCSKKENFGHNIVPGCARLNAPPDVRAACGNCKDDGTCPDHDYWLSILGPQGNAQAGDVGGFTLEERKKLRQNYPQGTAVSIEKNHECSSAPIFQTQQIQYNKLNCTPEGIRLKSEMKDLEKAIDDWIQTNITKKNIHCGKQRLKNSKVHFDDMYAKMFVDLNLHYNNYNPNDMSLVKLFGGLLTRRCNDINSSWEITKKF